MKKKEKARHFDNLMKLIRVRAYEEVAIEDMWIYIRRDIDGEAVTWEYGYKSMKELLAKQPKGSPPMTKKEKARQFDNLMEFIRGVRGDPDHIAMDKLQAYIRSEIDG